VKSGSPFFSAASLGQPEHARFRCLLPLGGKDIALGTDYGLVLYRQGRFEDFPFPAGARRESRCIESMALHEGQLYVATTRNWYVWDFEGEASGRGFPTDAHGEFDEIRTFFSTPGGLLKAWRSHLEGAEGPADCLCFARSPLAIYAGCRDGALHRLGEGEIHRFKTEGYAAPIRHLAYSDGSLWVGAAGALHRLREGAWQSREEEPFALSVDPQGQLWSAHPSGLRRSQGDWPTDAGGEFQIERPWSLAHTEGSTWVGTLGGVYSLASVS
jgi:hypothetical protein